MYSRPHLFGCYVFLTLQRSFCLKKLQLGCCVIIIQLLTKFWDIFTVMYYGTWKAISII
uniref:Uncharacterized protein n=1 Tax=Rhizophora mucronata TaxID=61149 RepID=A0A2P2Q4N6_RHIMU